MNQFKQIKISLLIVAALLVLAGAVWLVFGSIPEDDSNPQATEEATEGTTEEATEGSTEGKSVTVFDAKGEKMIVADTIASIYDSEYWAYLEVVISEAAEILAVQESCSATDARELLFANGYQIHTSFDSAAFESLAMAMSLWQEDCNTACALTDLEGSLVALYSSDVSGNQINYTQERRSPYSSFKALSVYTPAIEKGLITWSSMYPDTPYKQLKGEDGRMRDWPANAAGVYSHENTTVYEALRKSLNTVAVKCLADVGVTESMEFLQTSFGIPLTEETYVVQNYGAEEVIGNIALGYLETGITPVEMAGYYQIFANGGVYTKPESVQAICKEDGTAFYTRRPSSKQVISEATADLMNKLLQGVVAPGGTGEAVRCYDVEVAGKTGTGDGYADNWFVGVTPGYSLAVWHGQSDTNQAEEMFAAVVNQLYYSLPDANPKFITHQNLHQVAYCAHSGKVISDACTLIDVGYFADKDSLPVCDKCQNP